MHVAFILVEKHCSGVLWLVYQGPKLTVLCRHQVATEIFFSVAKWKNLVAKKWFLKFLLHSETQKTLSFKNIPVRLGLKTEHDATSLSHTSAKPSRSHARTSGHIARSRPLLNKIVRTSHPTSVIFVRQKHVWRRLNSDYGARITMVVKVI